MVSSLLHRRDLMEVAVNRMDWLSGEAKASIIETFGLKDGTSIIKSINNYLNSLDNTKAQNLANEINKYPVGYAHLFYDFQVVEYIKSTGTQYLKIPFIYGDGITKISCEYFPDTTGCIFSEWINTSIGGGISYEHQSNEVEIRAWIGNLTSDWFYARIGMTKHLVLFENDKWYIDDTLIVEKTQGSISGINNHIHIMARGIDGLLNAVTGITLYAFEMFAGNGYGVRLIPCYSVSSNEIGVYDIVNSQFHNNSGTDKFIKGNNTGPTPIIVH